MRVSVLRIASVLMCFVICLVCLTSCIPGVGGSVKKEEIPANAQYYFYSIENVKVENSEEFASQIDILKQMFANQHYLQTIDAYLNVSTLLANISCEDGYITYTYYEGEGSPSFINGGSAYAEYTTASIDLGTYSGTEVTLTEEAQEWDYRDAYVQDGNFVIHVESEEEGIILKYDIVFKKNK